MIDMFETDVVYCVAAKYFSCISYVNAQDCLTGRIFMANKGTIGDFRRVFNISDNSSNGGIVHRWYIGTDDDTIGFVC